jgi:hypothetical protein
MAAALRAAFFTAGAAVFVAAVVAAGATVLAVGAVLMVAAAVEGGIAPAVTESDRAGVVDRFLAADLVDLAAVIIAAAFAGRGTVFFDADFVTLLGAPTCRGRAGAAFSRAARVPAFGVADLRLPLRCFLGGIRTPLSDGKMLYTISPPN